MDFTAFTDTPDQAELRSVLRGFLAQHATSARVRQVMASPAGYDEAAWKRLTGELGLTALAVPEQFGGAGATLAEVAVAIEEIGRVLLPVPYLSTALVAALLAEASTPAVSAISAVRPLSAVPLAAAAASPAAAAALFLPGLADGTMAGALALGDGVTLSAGGRVSGTVWNVLDGPQADVFLVRAKDFPGGDALVAVRAADATVMPAPTLDLTRPQATVELDDAPALRVSPENDDGALTRYATELMRAALAAESAAAAARCLSLTVDYLKTRVQFGRPIGEFQALKHRCADLAVEAESAHMTARAAIQSALSDPSELMIAAPLAKRYCADAFFHAAAEMIQLHGGIGFTWEHDAHLYLKRAKSTQLLYGTPGELRTLIGHRAGLLP